MRLTHSGPGNRSQEKPFCHQLPAVVQGHKFGLRRCGNKAVILLGRKEGDDVGRGTAEAFEPLADVNLDKTIGSGLQRLGCSAQGMTFITFDINEQHVRSTVPHRQLIDGYGGHFDFSPARTRRPPVHSTGG